MKVDTPVIKGEGIPEELRIWMDQVSDLLNRGLYSGRVLSTAPAVGDLDIGEIAFGDATGASSAHEIFVKINSTTIARYTHDATIT